MVFFLLRLFNSQPKKGFSRKYYSIRVISLVKTDTLKELAFYPQTFGLPIYEISRPKQLLFSVSEMLPKEWTVRPKPIRLLDFFKVGGIKNNLTKKYLIQISPLFVCIYLPKWAWFKPLWFEQTNAVPDQIALEREQFDQGQLQC